MSHRGSTAVRVIDRLPSGDGEVGPDTALAAGGSRVGAVGQAGAEENSGPVAEFGEDGPGVVGGADDADLHHRCRAGGGHGASFGWLRKGFGAWRPGLGYVHCGVVKGRAAW